MILPLIENLRQRFFQADVSDLRRREGGYLLVIATILIFALSANYLLGQKMIHPEPVKLSYFTESLGREMTAAEALNKLRTGEFKNYNGGTESLDLGYMREGVWVLMEFKNKSDSTDERFVLQLRHAYISGSLTPLIAGSSGQAGESLSLGETRSFHDRSLPATQGFLDIRHVSLPIQVSAGAEFRALVRLRAHSMSVPFLILSEREFLSSIVREMVIIASFFGGLMLLAIYNLMVGVARREMEFIFYGLYVCSIALMVVALNGSGRMFIWPDFIWFHDNSSNLLINFCCINYLAFTFTLFRDAPLRGVEKVIWNGLYAFLILSLVVQIVEGGFFASIGANLAAVSSLCLCLVRAWRARPVYGRIANLFLISEGILFLGAFIYCVKMFGVLSSTPFTINIVTLAATLEGILLSFVLSEKMRRTMIEKASALELLAAAQKHLEASVRDKTLSLAARYTAHEVLNPVFALRLKTERIRDEIEFTMTNEQIRRFPPAQRILQKTKEMFLLIDSIIHTIRAIKALSSEGLHEEITDVDIESAFDDALRMLEAKTVHVQAEIVRQFSNAASVRARRSDVVQIFTNLLSNSLDAVSSERERWIRISDRLLTEGSRDGRVMLEISVVDSGPGPRSDIRENLFDDGVSTKNAIDGMGLGLAFCRKLVDRNDGLIAFDSTFQRTRFYFLLPVYDSLQKTSTEPEFSKAA